MNVAVVLVALLLGLADTAAAQGRGRGVGRGSQGGPPGASTRSGGQTSGAPSARPASPSFPQFGTWLDDATTAAPGAGYASFGVSYWRGAGASQIDAPILGLAYGVAPRTQLAVTVPFYRASYDGSTGAGLDNVYLTGKISLVDPNANGRIGLAVSGVAEILGAGFADASRLHWALPVGVEVRADRVRVYASAGYFSRGAIFTAGALEWTAPAGTSITAAVAHSASVRGITMATTTAMPSEHLVDASVFVSQPVSAIASVYAAGSRTFSSAWIGGATSVSGGVSVRFAAPRAPAE